MKSTQRIRTAQETAAQKQAASAAKNEPSKSTIRRFWQGRRSWGRPLPAPNILRKGPCINRAPPIVKLQHVLPYQSVINIMKCIYCLNCPKFGQLIIRKIIRIVATRCQIFGGKNVQNSISTGALPQTQFEELTAFHLTPWLLLKGPTSKGRGGRVNEGENEGRERSLGPPIFTTDRRPWILDILLNEPRYWGKQRSSISHPASTVSQIAFREL